MPASAIQKLSSQAISSLRMGAVVVFAVCLAQFGVAQRLPDAQKTPGVAGITDTAKVCSLPSTKDVRHVTAKQKAAIYKAYGVKPGYGICAWHYRVSKKGKRVREGCEIDHLISLELGGANDSKNLWPQPYYPAPGAHEKDRLENWLHKEVCAGRMTLQFAQDGIAKDWFALYQAMPSH